MGADSATKDPTSKGWTAIGVLCGVLGVIFGAGAMVAGQTVAKPSMDPIVETCTDAAKFAKSDLHAYEPWLGGPFVCIITNFLLELTKTPEGVFIWNMIAGLGFPAGLMINIEAYRYGSKGPVRFPTILSVLSQFLGISVIFPLIWIPGYAWGGSRDGQIGVSRVVVSLLLSVPFAVVSALVFTLDTSSYAWTFAAGSLGGPAIALLPLLLWPLPQLSEQTAAGKAKGARALARAYDIAGLLALGSYVRNAQLLIEAYGFDLPLFYDKLWTQAGGAVAFMTIDTGVLYLGILLFLLLRRASDLLPAVLLLPLVGPGAACAVALAQQERSAAAAAEKGGEKRA